MSMQMGGAALPLAKLANNKVCRCKSCRGNQITPLKRMELRIAKRKAARQLLRLEYPVDDLLAQQAEKEELRDLMARSHDGHDYGQDHDRDFYEPTEYRPDDGNYGYGAIGRRVVPEDLYAPGSYVWTESSPTMWHLKFISEVSSYSVGYEEVGVLFIDGYTNWLLVVAPYAIYGQTGPGTNNETEQIEIPYMESSLDKMQRLGIVMHRLLRANHRVNQ